MPSLPRNAIIEDGATFHVTWKCHNNDWLLKTTWAKHLYRNLLLRYKDRYRVEIYSYCLMDNHPHLSGRLSNLQLFSDFFRVVNSIFARLYNQEVKRRGQVVMDRFKSPQIQTDRHLLQVMLYIDLNPRRAGKVSHPKDNEFSSFAYYAYGHNDPLITPAPSYLALGLNPGQRQTVYLRLVEEILRNDWREKRPYTSYPFIGDPDWVTGKIRILREIRKDKRRRWFEHHQIRFGRTRI